MSYYYRNAINSGSIDDFQEAFNREVLPKINEFLKKYNLTTNHGSYMKYDNSGIKISCDTVYQLANGAKPWDESNFKEELDRLVNNRKELPQHYDDCSLVFAFADDFHRHDYLIGRLVQFPNASKKNREKTYKITGYNEGSRYPFETECLEDGKQTGWAWDWSMKFVD